MTLVLFTYSCNNGITDPKSEPLEITFRTKNVSSPGQSDGSIDLIVTGGTSPYLYRWSNGKTSKDISNLAADNYSVSVTDANQDSITDSTTITEPELFKFILYDDLSLSDIIDVSEALKSNYNRIINDLQVTNMPQVTVRIWSNYDNFMEVMGSDLGIRYQGASGYIFSEKDLRIFYTNSAPLIAVHEFAHLVSMQINRYIPNNPRWLWEAVALYESRDFIDPNTLTYMVSGNYPTLEDLNTDYNSSNHNIYSVGYVLLEYIVQTWGMDAVIRLIEAYGHINYILGITIQDFESGWYRFIEEEYFS